MAFIVWLQANKKLVAIGAAIAFIFFSGWYCRGVFEEAKQGRLARREAAAQHEIEQNNYEQSQAYEKQLEDFNKENLDLNQELDKTHEDNYSCIIPANGLRILKSAR